MTTSKDPAHDPHGEGNHDADRRYRERTKEFIESGRLEDKADEAKEAVEGDENAELERAKEKARRKSSGS